VGQRGPIGAPLLGVSHKAGWEIRGGEPQIYLRGKKAPFRKKGPEKRRNIWGENPIYVSHMGDIQGVEHFAESKSVTLVACAFSSFFSNCRFLL